MGIPGGEIRLLLNFVVLKVHVWVVEKYVKMLMPEEPIYFKGLFSQTHVHGTEKSRKNRYSRVSKVYKGRAVVVYSSIAVVLLGACFRPQQ